MAKKILIVDDEKNIRTSLTYYLNKFEYDADTASSGNEALELLKKIQGSIWTYTTWLKNARSDKPAGISQNEGYGYKN